MQNIIDTLRRMRGATPEDMPPKEAGAMLALLAFGPDVVGNLPILINFGVLKLLTGSTPPLLSVRSAASRLVSETDLHSLPSEPPKLLRSPAILQASHLRKPLFGSTVGLACYEIDGVRYLLGLTTQDEAMLAKWHPDWQGGEIDDSVPHDHSPLIDGITEHRAWAQAAAQYLVTMGILLDADNSPLELRRIKKSKHNERGIFFDPTEPQAAYEASTEGNSEKLAAAIRVSGHLKRQRYGPGLAGTRWIWVSEYAARRWVSHLAHYVDSIN